MSRSIKNKQKILGLFFVVLLFLVVLIANQLQPKNKTISSQALIPTPTPGPVAFPGAEGFGANTKGGRGGRVIEVTNLNDSGPGSLRECAAASGSRVCVFRVAGNITLNSDIDITNPFITIAGQTAPGGGITLKAANPASTVHMQIRTQEVILRYIRSRPGTKEFNSRALSLNNGQPTMATAVKNVIIDHNSFSWAGDELTITWLATNNISYQWNIASESFPPTSGDVGIKGPSFGEDGGGYFSVHHNLIAHHTQRLPQVSASVGPVDLVNNVIYNPGGQASVVKNGTRANYINNYIKTGPNSTLNAYIQDGGAKGPATGYYVGTGNFIDDHRTTSMRLNTAINEVNTPYPAPAVTTTTSQIAYEQVLSDAGASRGLTCNGTWVARRDGVDTRVVQSVRDRTRGHGGTGYITSPTAVGGWPNLDPGTPCLDSDHDGMPDQWETANFGNLSQGSTAASTSNFDTDGYTDLEEYLNGTNPKVAEGGIIPTITAGPTTITPTIGGPTPTRTRTPTRTPTQAATAAKLRFKIKLPDLASSVTAISGEDVMIEAIDGSIAVAQTSVPLVRSGSYFQTSADASFNLVQDKIYTITIKTRSSLKRNFAGVNLTRSQLLDCTVSTNTDCGGLITQRDVRQLLSGDSDGFNQLSGSYNRVDSADLQFLSLSYSQNVTDANKGADFNLDNQINIFDLEILGKNYGQLGD